MAGEEAGERAGGEAGRQAGQVRIQYSSIQVKRGSQSQLLNNSPIY